ncbi:hypothetical protein [Arthrobacter sp. AG1021]|uniref:hypothetical protein n=1 Tax=Arthrobacter sp. AG1021 TaxID=2183908 RepID=UPI0016035144|nr:hypothetical protein [Arthrobacter sp. AG1021]
MKAFVRYLLGVDSALSMQVPQLSDGALAEQQVEIPDLDPLFRVVISREAAYAVCSGN